MNLLNLLRTVLEVSCMIAACLGIIITSGIAISEAMNISKNVSKNKAQKEGSDDDRK